jgi:hypothetical protein
VQPKGSNSFQSTNSAIETIRTSSCLSSKQATVIDAPKGVVKERVVPPKRKRGCLETNINISNHTRIVERVLYNILGVTLSVEEPEKSLETGIEDTTTTTPKKKFGCLSGVSKAKAFNAEP